MDHRLDCVALAQELRLRGNPLTPQRQAILRFLDGNTDHPTAAQILEAVTADFPVVSRATVYNTLGLLEELGAVRTVRGGDGTLRYDPNTSPHHHLCCPRCGRLEDVPLEAVTLLLRGEPASGTVQLEALCGECAC